MGWTLFNLEGVIYLLRWLHYFWGVVWIGHLYYFNFVQGAFLNEVDGPTKLQAQLKLLPKALWWFRWGAMWTMVTGVLILGLRGHTGGFGVFGTSWGLSILLGASLGLLMWANVWFVIWPKQQIVIRSAQQVSGGGQAIAEAASAGARALVASRTNVVFSVSMLFFMGAASHLNFAVSSTTNWTVIALACAAILGAFEWNAVKGKTGIMTTVRGAIHTAFALALVFYVLLEVLIRV